MEANKGGETWKHPNLVIGYVAQHAFHHIDNHLDKTPLEYMLWRYQTGEDLEELQKANRQISEEEAQKMKDGSLIVIEGQKRIIDEILMRKKLKQSYEYEVSLKGLSSSENIWLPRDDLLKRGFEKVRSILFIVWVYLTNCIFLRLSESPRSGYSRSSASWSSPSPCST
jgi:elongation factor 3